MALSIHVIEQKHHRTTDLFRSCNRLAAVEFTSTCGGLLPEISCGAGARQTTPLLLQTLFVLASMYVMHSANRKKMNLVLGNQPDLAMVW